MNKYIVLILVIPLFLNNYIFSVTSGTGNAIFTYISPTPNSELNQPGTNIIIKFSDLNKPAVFNENNILVQGSFSKACNGTICKTDNINTFIFKPNNKFRFGETVWVTIRNIRKNNINIPEYSFKFKISKKIVSFDFDAFYRNEFETSGIPESVSINKNSRNNPTDTLPSDFPQFTVIQNNQSTSGNIFLSNFPNNPSLSTPYLMIINNYCQPIWYRKMSASCFDFKRQSPNLISYFDGAKNKYFLLNNSFNIIDSFYCGNGYSTDLHELRILSNGHAFLLSYDPETVDMSQYVDGGDPDAIVIGLIIQELDNNKNVVFQWRSWDHFQIIDATHENLLAHTIDYVHGNAIEILNDRNILLSSRHLDEITKINTENGSIIWRWGGKNNQFTFENDPIQFSHQHSIRIIANGDYTMFDNGNYHNPPFSRALEYKIDETSKIATLVWQFQDNPQVYGGFMGYVQRLSNGNTLISWGGTNPSVTEVNPYGLKVLEFSLPTNIFSYRASEVENNPSNPMVNIIPNNFILKQNYPNPFNPTTKIDYYIPENSNVNLNVYDLTGRLIATLVNANQFLGYHEVEFDSRNLSSGIYFYRLEANNFTETKKLVVLK